MNIAEYLDQMRRDIPDCSLVSFGDLRTGLSLRASAADPLRQDQLEEILQHAAFTFSVSDALAATGETETAGRQSAIVARPQGVLIFVRSPDEPSDVICCLCRDAAAEARIVNGANKLFHGMAGDS